MWYLAAVTGPIENLKILDVKPCAATGYVAAWKEAGAVRREKGSPYVIVIDEGVADLWARR